MRILVALPLLLASPAFGQTLPSPSFDGIINVLSYSNVKNDATGISSCTISAAGTTLTCAGASFTSADVGKYYYLQGSGAANIPQTGTISAVLSSTSLTIPQATVATPQYGIYSPPASPVTVLAAGSGYTPGTQTLTITGGTGTTAAQVSVTVSGGGAVTAVLSMVTPGVYTVIPPSGSATTGGGGTGATFTTGSYQMAGRFLYCTDSTAGIRTAVTAAAGKKLIFPAGGYCLASAITPIALNNLSIEGSGKAGYGWPFTNASFLFIFNKTTETFSGLQGVDWNGLSAYWPEQDNSTVSPTVFPPLFRSPLIVNTNFRNSRFVNAYDRLEVSASAGGSGLGRVYSDNVQGYCVHYCYNILNGAADVFVSGDREYVGVGAFDANGTQGPANLGRYTAANGEFIHVDTSGGGYANIDGLNLSGLIINGMRYGVRVVSGLVDVSTINNVKWDNGGTLLSVEGSGSQMLSASIDGGILYSTNIYDTSSEAIVVNFASANSASKLKMTGVNVPFALGSVVVVSGNGIAETTLVGNTFDNFGRSTTAGTYVGFNGAANYNGLLNITGNTFNCNKSTGVPYGINILAGAATYEGTITGNVFQTCQFPIALASIAGSTVISGNITRATAGSTSLNDGSSTNHVTTLGANVFDKVPALRRPTATSPTCGAGTPVVNTNSSWQRGSVALVGVTTSCALVWTALPYAPASCTGNTSDTAITVAMGTPTTTGFTATFSGDMAGATFNWQCGP